MTTDRGTRDLGIFVKSVIHGGAASKVGYMNIFIYTVYLYFFVSFHLEAR